VDDREGGYIKLHRKWLTSPTVQALGLDGAMVWLHILFAANWKATEVMVRDGMLTVERGQALISERALAERAGTSRKVVRTTLKRLVTSHSITLRAVSSKMGPSVTLITVVNYSEYQDTPENGAQAGPKVGPRWGPIRRRSEEEEEEASEEGVEQRPLLAVAPMDRPRVAPTTPLGRFIASVWSDVEDPDALEARLRVAYPQVDLLGEARKAWAWEQSRPPSSRKKAHAAFFTNWVGRARPTLVATPQAPRRVFSGLDEHGKPTYQED
jgi:hypothetical protein